MHRLAVGALAGFAALTGCLREKVTYCKNGAFCPDPLACTDRDREPYCGDVHAVGECYMKPDETVCHVESGELGFCDKSLCTLCTPNIAACDFGKWVTMPLPTSVDLYAMWVAGPRDLYAVGKAGTFIHWDGSAWAVLPAPPGTGDLRAVAGADPNDIWAAATTSLFHYDGTSWIQDSVAAPNSILGLWGAGSGDFFGAGLRATASRGTSATWTYSENTLNLMNTSFSAIWGRSNSDVFIGGGNGTILHWNGTAWSQQPTMTTHLVLAVTGAGNDVYAVGKVSGTNTAAALHSTNNVWTDVSATLPMELQTTQVSLRGVWSGGATVFAVGDGGKIVADTGGGWSLMPSNVTVALNAVSGNGRDVFAVGNAGTVLRYRVP